MRFSLHLEFADQGNITAEHAKVRECLALAAQAIGSSPARKGDLMLPRFDPGIGCSRPVKIGNWEFTE